MMVGEVKSWNGTLWLIFSALKKPSKIQHTQRLLHVDLGYLLCFLLRAQ